MPATASHPTPQCRWSRPALPPPPGRCRPPISPKADDGRGPSARPFPPPPHRPRLARPGSCPYDRSAFPSPLPVPPALLPLPAPPAPSPLPASGNCGFALPVAGEAKPEFPQRSKIPRISESPMGFSGTARRRGVAKRRRGAARPTSRSASSRPAPTPAAPHPRSVRPRMAPATGSPAPRRPTPRSLPSTP